MKITAALVSYPPGTVHPLELALDGPKCCSQQCYHCSVSFFIIFKYHLLVLCWQVCLPCQSAYLLRAEAISVLCMAEFSAEHNA